MRTALLKNDLKVLLRSKAQLAMYAAFLVFSCLSLQGRFTDQVNHPSENFYFAYLRDCLKIVPVFFVIMMFSSYAFLKMVNGEAEETLSVTKKSLQSIYIRRIAILSFIVTAVSAVFFGLNTAWVAAKGLQDGHFTVYLLLQILLSFFFGGLVAVFAGALCSVVGKKSGGFLLLPVLCLVFLCGEVAEGFTPLLKISYGMEIGPLVYPFQLFDFGLKWSCEPCFGYPVLPYRLYRFLFWIFLFLAVFLALTVKKSVKKDRKQRVVYIVSFLLFIGCFVLYLQPSSKILRNYSSKTTNFEITDYYSPEQTRKDIEGIVKKNMEPDFRITDYELKMKIRQTLTASAVIRVDDPTLNEYDFTLSHLFKVSGVYDEKGSRLAFEREYDYLYAHPSSPFESLRIEYSGYSSVFYTNFQGINLPAGFLYYPVAGVQRLFRYTKINEVQWNNDIAYVPEQEADFHIELDYRGFDKEVYSNLKLLSHEGSLYTFAGRTQAVSLMNGLFDSVSVNGTTLVYYKYHRYYAGGKAEKLLREILENEKAAAFYKNKTILMTPVFNGHGSKEAVTGDSVVLWNQTLEGSVENI